MSDSRINILIMMPRMVQKPGDGYPFPLGIPYVSSSLKKQGFNVFTLNLNHRDGDTQAILRNEITLNNIDVMATGGLSFQYSIIREVIGAARRIKPDIKIIVGGGIITSDPETAMTALGYADYGVIGEGEITSCELCDALEKNKAVDEIKGIIYRSAEGAFLKTGPRKEIDNIDLIPWPDYEGFEFARSLENSPSTIGINEKNVAFMITSRSCPYSCTFCFHTAGKKYRQRSLDGFFEELEKLIDEYEVRYVNLLDELFAIDEKRVDDFCERIRKYNIRWLATLRVDNVSPELLSLLKKSGCDTIALGLESADDRVLKSMRKNITLEQIEYACEVVYGAGIHIQSAFIFGDIAETAETAANTIRWWQAHREYKIQLAQITVYPGSYLYKYACDNGIILDRVKYLQERCPNINLTKMKDKEYGDLLRGIEEMISETPIVPATMEYSNIDFQNGKFDIRGECRVCRGISLWKDIMFFVSTHNFLGCEHCGQKYDVVYPPEFYENIDKSLSRLLDKYGKIGMWCMSLDINNIAKYCPTMQSDNIFLIDNSTIKQATLINNKKINAPNIIAKQNIPAVICLDPVHYATILSTIRENYAMCERVIDIRACCIKQ